MQHVLTVQWLTRVILSNLVLLYPSVLNNGGTESFISLLDEFGFKSRLSLRYLKEEEAGEHFDRMNCGQRSLLRGLISLCAIESEQSGYGKCLDKISTCKQASGGVQTKLSQLFSLQKSKQANGEGTSSSFFIFYSSAPGCP